MRNRLTGGYLQKPLMTDFDVRLKGLFRLEGNQNAV